MQSGANIDDPMAKERSVWLADSKPTAQATRHEVPSGISPSLLTPIGAGFVLVKQRVTRQAGKVPTQKSNAVVLADTRRRFKNCRSSGPVAQPTTQVPLIVEFVRSGASSFLFGSRVLVKLGNTVVLTQMVNCQPASAGSRRDGMSEWSMLLPSTWARSPLYKWKCILPEKRDRHHHDSHMLVGRRQDWTPRGA